MPEPALSVVRQTVQADPEEGLDISESELIRALEQASAAALDDGDGYMTTNDLAAALSWTPWRTRQELRVLHGQGRLESRRVPLKDISGRVTRVPAYKLRQE